MWTRQIGFSMSSTSKWEPMCQSITGPPVDEAIGTLIAEQMTPAVVELALEVTGGSKPGMKKQTGCAIADRTHTNGSRSRSVALHACQS